MKQKYKKGVDVMIQKLKGTRDILPGEIEKWKYVEETARRRKTKR